MDRQDSPRTGGLYRERQVSAVGVSDARSPLTYPLTSADLMPISMPIAGHQKARDWL